MKVEPYFIVTTKYLKEHPNTIFVYSGNYSHYLPLYLNREVIDQLHPFMVQVLPSTRLNRDGKFFTPRAYLKYIYPIEQQLLVQKIKENPDKEFLIDPIGYFMYRNPWDVFSSIINDKLRDKMRKFNNVTLLWGGINRRK